jgi:hypothetical protein
MSRPGKLTTRMPSLVAMDRAGDVCKALAEREERDGDREAAEALRRAGEICKAKAVVGAVLRAHQRGEL